MADWKAAYPAINKTASDMADGKVSFEEGRKVMAAALRGPPECPNFGTSGEATKEARTRRALNWAEDNRVFLDAHADAIEQAGGLSELDSALSDLFDFGDLEGAFFGTGF